MAAPKEKRRVWIWLGSTLIVVGAWGMWTRARLPVPAEKASLASPAVRLTQPGAGLTDQVMRDRAEYFDPTPLFFPTEWNYGQGALRDSMKRQPGQVFGEVEPKFVNFNPPGAEAPEIRLPDVVAAGNEVPFGGMGEIDVKPIPVAERSGFLEVKRLRDGETIIAQPLTGLVLPNPDFAPLEFLVVVGSAGLVAEPVLTAGSGWEDVDSHLRSYLAKTFRVGERVRPGIYRILIGP